MAEDRTILAFDFGMKRIGVALGQSLLNTARPLKTLAANQGEPNWQHIADLIKEWGVDTIVVGIPVNIDGTEQFTTEAARLFAEQLKEKTQLPVHPVDERLTTVEARQQLFDEGGYKALNSAEVDSWAAKIMLEQWLSIKE